jgi:digeranylgeranylglycerophospholipid reductase
MIAIIGAGPVGSYCAYLLAREGFKVHLFEEHPKAGIPVQCTGIVTKNIFNYAPKSREFVINHFNSVQAVSPDNSYAEIPLNEYLLDRTKFDNFLLNQALAAGAKVHFSHRFIEIKNNKAIFKTKDGLVGCSYQYLIGADGPLSKVAKSAGIYNNREFFIGMQAVVRGNFGSHTFTTFFGNKIAPGFFAWVVPESSTTARVGLATRNNTNHYFQNFLNANKFQPIEYQGGLIPIYNSRQVVQKDNICLMGDAACLVKSTTGGGLVPGLESAKLLARCILNNRFGDYSRNLKKLRLQLYLHNILRNTLDTFEDTDYMQLIMQMKKQSVQKILETEDRDLPMKLLLKLTFAEPKVLLFFRKMALNFKKRKIFKLLITFYNLGGNAHD